jgi:hypothetical protein
MILETVLFPSAMIYEAWSHKLHEHIMPHFLVIIKKGGFVPKITCQNNCIQYLLRGKILIALGWYMPRKDKTYDH